MPLKNFRIVYSIDKFLLNRVPCSNFLRRFDFFASNIYTNSIIIMSIFTAHYWNKTEGHVLICIKPSLKSIIQNFFPKKMRNLILTSFIGLGFSQIEKKWKRPTKADVERIGTEPRYAALEKLITHFYPKVKVDKILKIYDYGLSDPLSWEIKRSVPILTLFLTNRALSKKFVIKTCSV